jgi:predicted kinase
VAGSPANRQHEHMYLLVTGPPASGKTYVARLLADEMRLPLLSKDTIKDALIGVLGAADVEASRQLGRAAVTALLGVAHEVGFGVIDSVWVDRARWREQLPQLPGRLVEVFCRCDVQVMESRFLARSREHRPRYFDLHRSREELWPASSLAPLDGPWPVIEVDTSRDVDAAAIVRALHSPQEVSNSPGLDQ